MDDLKKFATVFVGRQLGKNGRGGIFYFSGGIRHNPPKRGTKVRVIGPEVPESDREWVIHSATSWAKPSASMRAGNAVQIPAGEQFNITEIPE